MNGGWTYILTNRPNGVLYTGVTADLVPRVYQHRSGEVSGFTSRYGIGRLVWFEWHQEIVSAIAREKSIKNWARADKVRLIRASNWEWVDLYPGLL